MFGYIVLSQKADKKDKETYREAYCGLCHALKEKYKKDGMMALSYDMTFLSLLLSDLTDSPVTRDSESCVIHPLVKHNYFTTPLFSYTSDMQILLSYYSLLDSVNDENKEKKREKRFSLYLPELEEKYPRQANSVKSNLMLLGEEEKKNSKDVDKNALLFGSLLAEIFVFDEKNHFAPELSALGCALGKFIYILDAYDDRKSDKKKGLYNPLDDNITQQEIMDKLLDAASLASTFYEKLPLDEYVSITNNIIYSGMWSKLKVDKNESI